MKISFNGIEIDTDNLTDEVKKQLQDALAETDSGIWVPALGEKHWWYGGNADVQSSNFATSDYPGLYIGNAFKTEELARKHVAYLEAVQILRNDAKGYQYREGDQYYVGYYDRDKDELDYDFYTSVVVEGVKFASTAHINESFVSHEKEWRIVLGVK
jgi:hypothetical protein